MVSVKHKFVSQKGDGPDSTLVQPSDWNDEHDITVSATNRILGRISAGGGDVEELTGADIRTIADVYSKSEVYTKAEAGGGFGLMEDVASASTTNLGSVAGRNVRITGSATIASFGSGASLDAPVYLLTFTGAATLQNSANLILPGGDDIVTSAGDTAIAVYLGSGAWRVIAYNGLATEADARSGTVTGKLMTPQRVAQAIESLAPGVGGAYRNLVVQVTSDTQVAITADRLVIENASGDVLRLSSVNVTADISTSGANGLDTGAEAADTWYSVWVIYNPSTTTAAALLSASMTSPTLPSGYTYQAYVGAVRNDGSSNLYRTLQKGARAQYIVGTNPTSARQIGSGNAGNVSTPTWVALSIASFVPTTAARIIGWGRVGGVNGNIIVAPNNSYGGASVSDASNPPPVGIPSINGISIPFEFVIEGPNIYWACSASNGFLGVLGWVDGNL